MPRLSGNKLPSYRRHRASGQAVVTLNGRDHYLGPFGSSASRKQYDRLLSEWIANGRGLPSRPDTTIVELIAAYLRFAAGYYRESDECANVVLAVRPLKELYGKLPAAEFSPLKLKAVREKMIEANLCRNEINKRIGRIKRIFRWAVENELVQAEIHHGLQAVRGLARGRSQARESAPVKPVPDTFVDAVQSHVSPQVWAMVQLQRYTGMRPGEVCVMRTCDIDTSGNVWIYSPANHKTAYRGHQRKIFLGPRAQAVLKSWLRLNIEEYLFQPREAMAAKRQAAHSLRKTPLSCGNRPGSNKKKSPQKMPGLLYNPRSYHQAIRQACLRAEIPNWHPHQLRHNAATWLRKEFGLDVARVVLGHRSPRITEVYAELDEAKAENVMREVG